MIEAGFESDGSAWSVFLPRCRGRLWRGKTGITFVEEVVLKTFEYPTFCVLRLGPGSIPPSIPDAPIGLKQQGVDYFGTLYIQKSGKALWCKMSVKLCVHARSSCLAFRFLLEWFADCRTCSTLGNHTRGRSCICSRGLRIQGI